MPAPPLSNTFDGGADGVTIDTANSGGDSGDIFNSAIATPVFTVRGRDRIGMKIVDPGGNTSVGWTGLGSITGAVYFRIHMFLTAYPVTNRCYILRLNNAASGACCFLRIFTSGIMSASDASDSGFSAEGVVPITLNQWVRVEARIVPGVGTGELNWRLYNDAGSNTPSEDRGNFTGKTFAANLDQALFGVNQTPPVAPFTIYMDEIAVSTAGWIGPYGGMSTATATAPGGFAQPGRAGPGVLRFFQGMIGQNRLSTVYATNDIVAAPTTGWVTPPIFVSREAHRRSTRW